MDPEDMDPDGAPGDAGADAERAREPRGEPRPAPQGASGASERSASSKRGGPAPSPAPSEPSLTASPEPKAGTSEPAVEIVGVTFLSDPPGASIFLNGVLVGRTPLRDHPVSAGSYALSLQQDGRVLERTVRLGGRRGSTRFEWRGDQLLAQ